MMMIKLLLWKLMRIKKVFYHQFKSSSIYAHHHHRWSSHRNRMASSKFNRNVFGFEVLFIIFTISVTFLVTKCYGSQALEFTIEPSDAIVPEGHSVLLQCAGTAQPGALKEGKTAPNIRWRGPDGQDLGIVGDTFRTQLQNGSLYISSVEENRGLTGAYQCLLTVDSIGTIVSRSAIVTIARLPEINQDFIETYLLPGQTAYFRCIIGQQQPGLKHQIQWLKDDVPLRFDSIRMVILPNGALEIDDVTPNDQGTYQCNVTSGTVSRLSSKSNLNIKKISDLTISSSINVNAGNIGGNSNASSNDYIAAPSFLIGPSPQTVKEGDTVTLDCVANGVPKPQIKWLKNGEEIDLNHLDSRFSIIGTGSLQIASAEDTDSGNYQCRASNTVDSLDAQATVQVQVPPKFIQTPSEKTAYEKDELELECSIRGKPKPVVKWLKNGDVITPNDYMQLVGGHNLRILGLLDSDAGMFQCVGSNPAGSIQAAARLIVLQPGERYEQNKTLSSSSSLSSLKNGFNKQSKTTKSLKNRNKKYKNHFNGNNADDNNKNINSESIDDRNLFDLTNYYNRYPHSVRNDNNVLRTKSSDSRILSKSALDSLASKDKEDKNRNSDDEDYFDLKNYGTNNNQNDDDDDEDDNDNNNHHDFTHNVKDNNNSNNYIGNINDEDNDEYIDNDDDVDNDSNDDDDEDDNNDDDDDEGIIHPFKPGDDPNKILSSWTNKKRHKIKATSTPASTNIEEAAMSPFSTISRKHTSTISSSSSFDDIHLDRNKSGLVPLPGPPRDLVAQIIKPRFVTLSWMEPQKNPDEVISYTVYYKMSTSERERKIQTNSRDDQQANIQSLLPGKTYQLRVVGNSNHGPGESSEILEVNTQPEENIAGPPRNVEGYALNHKEIYIKWEPPLITNGIISKYRIYYAENDGGTEMYTDSDTKEARLSELRPNTEYSITIVPFNQNGMGDPSNEIKVKTYSSTPSEPPSNVTLEVTSSTSITIHWEPPPEKERNGQITGYKIRYKKLRDTLQVKTTPATVRHFELNKLERMSEYQIKIAAMTVNGTGPFTEWHRVVTYENDLDETQVPGKPRWIAVRAGAASIALHWAPPAQQDIKIRNYILGWGKGIPDENTQELSESTRFHELKNLEPNTEYVISLRARNIKGDGPPIYDNIKTREDDHFDVPLPLEVPVGLRAITMSSTSIVVYWTDTTLSKNQQVSDNRHYTVRYGSPGSSRFRYHNTTDLNCMITDLKPNTQYEFAVKVVKGRRESSWSMSVLNTTFQSLPISPPRDLIVKPDDSNPQNVILYWQPPKHSNNIGSGAGTAAANQAINNGYIIYYTTDPSKRDRDWSVEAVIGDTTTAVIKNLQPFSTYYFKVQSKSLKGNAPFSALVSYMTGPAVQEKNLAEKEYTNQMIVYLIVGVTIVTLFIALAVVVVLCRRKPLTSPEHTKKSYQKNNVGIPKPPDLWIHHEQMELKSIEKGHSNTPGCSDGASSSGAMTLPRSVVHEYDTDTTNVTQHITNSLDKRSYVPGYMTTSVNSTMERPQYPRTQYNVSNRSHIDTALSQQSLTHSQAQTPDNQYTYEAMPPPNYSNASLTYAGISVEAAKRGHPLKSFSVPSPPPITTPVITNSTKHNVPSVTIRPQNSSPYKKPSFTNTTPTNRLQSGPSVAHSNDEIQRLAPSTSTEELNQEMANLEGLMKDLSAITANEFEC